MRKILPLLACLTALTAPAQAQNYSATAGSGLTFGAKLVGGVLYPQQTMCDPTTPAQCLAVDASGRVTVLQGTSPWVVSNGGTFAAQVNGFTSWAGGTLGAMANYGTSPGAVLVPGVNAFITNTPPVTQSGTWTVQPGNTANTTPWLASISQGGSTAVVKAANTVASTDVGVVVAVANTNNNGQAAAGSSSPVVVAKNSGTGSTVAGAAVGTAGSASAEVVTVQGVSGGTPQNVAPQATSTGAATPFKLIAAASNNSTLISTGAHSVYSYQTGSLSASTPYWLKFYDKATAPTCGTDTPIKVILVPPTNSGNNGNIPVGFSVALGLGICVVGGIADSDNTSAAATTVAINVDYK